MFIECLETRRLLCGVVASVGVSSSTDATQTAIAMVRVASPKILTAAQVTGNYKGTATVPVLGTSIPLKLKVTQTSATLTVTGFGSGTASLSSKTFSKLRAGSFNLTMSVGASGSKLNLTLKGTVTKSGKTYSGTFSATSAGSSSAITGTFTLKKA